MCKSCGCEDADLPFKYKCDCKDDKCSCESIIEFKEEPKTPPYCCGVPMKKI